MSSYNAKISRNIEEFGWHATAIEDGWPPFVYTSGLTTHHNHPEIIILGLQSKVAYPILNTIVAEIKKGRSFSEDGKYSGILEGLMIAIHKVHGTQHEMFLADAMSHCRFNAKDLVARQIFWPDIGGLDDTVYFCGEINAARWCGGLS